MSNSVNGDSPTVQGPDSPLPQFSDLDFGSAGSRERLMPDIIASMQKSGVCIVRNMVGKSSLDEIEAQIRPHLESAARWNGDFYPYESRRATGCLTKSKAYAIDIVNHPIWRAVGDHFLTTPSRFSWKGRKKEQHSSLPQLSNTVVFSILPGAHSRPLHRDDDTHCNDQRSAAAHHLGRDTGATMFVAAKPSTVRNGATRFIPGSHLWDYSVPPPVEDSEDGRRLICHAELNAGDALLMLSGCIHGSGANTTTDEERLIYSALTVRGWLRQEENQYLANDHDLMRELPTDLQQFAGWSLSRPGVGWVNFADPVKFLTRSGVNGAKVKIEGTEEIF